MSHVPCAASYATAGSLARGASPGGRDALVSDGRMPELHVRPESAEVAQPIPAAPPSPKRPTWKVATAVEPQPATLGSTSVWCWPGALVERVDGDPPRHELAVPRDRVRRIGGDGVDALAAGDRSVAAEHDVDAVGLRRALQPVGPRRSLDHGGADDRRRDQREQRTTEGRRRAHESTVPEAIRSSALGGEGR